MSPLEIGWTGLAVFGLATVLINLADAWADNVTLQDDTRDGLADLQAAGNVIAVDNIGREVLVLIGLSSCLALGVMALLAPNPPPTTPERQRVVVVFQLCLIVIEVCLVLISVLGRVRRINVHRMLQLTIRARAEAASAGRQADLAVAAVTTVVPAEEARAAVEEAAAQPRPPEPQPHEVPPPGTIPQAGEPGKTNQ